MNNPYTGLVNVTGEPDTGKTAFCLTTGAMPERIAFFDDDIKGQIPNAQIEAASHHFGIYHNLVSELRGMRETQIHDTCIRMIEAIKPGDFDVIVWDTWTRFEATLFRIVQANPLRFREAYAPMGKIATAERWVASFDYEAVILDMLLTRAPLVVITAHTKDNYVNDVKIPGSSVPASKRPIVQKSTMRLWLRHNPNSPAPVGLVLKRPQKYIVDPARGLQLVNVLPRRVDPCTWDTLLAYWDEPMGARQPTQAELPTPFELSILDGTLTADQRDMLKTMARVQVIVGESPSNDDVEGMTLDTVELTAEQIQHARDQVKEGKKPRDIAKELGIETAQLFDAVPGLMG